MFKLLYQTNNKKKNKELVNVIKSRLSDLENEIEKMSEDEKKFEKPDEILDVVKKTVEFNEKIQSGGD